MFAQLRGYLPTAALGLLILYFGIHALTGSRGILSNSERDATLAAKEAELVQARLMRQDLEVRAHLLRDESLSADLLDERARSILGYADPKDYVIRVRP